MTVDFRLRPVHEAVEVLLQKELPPAEVLQAVVEEANCGPFDSQRTEASGVEEQIGAALTSLSRDLLEEPSGQVGGRRSDGLSQREDALLPILVVHAHRISVEASRTCSAVAWGQRCPGSHIFPGLRVGRVTHIPQLGSSQGR